MRPPNAPPGLPHHPVPALRGPAPAYIRTGMRVTLSWHCCADTLAKLPGGTGNEIMPGWPKAAISVDVYSMLLYKGNASYLHVIYVVSPFPAGHSFPRMRLSPYFPGLVKTNAHVDKCPKLWIGQRVGLCWRSSDGHVCILRS